MPEITGAHAGRDHQIIERNLADAGAWGGGAKLYRSGPFVKGTREQGYQLS